MKSGQVGKAPVFGAGYRGFESFDFILAKLVELVDTLGLGSNPQRGRGSSPLFGKNVKIKKAIVFKEKANQI